MWKRQAKLFVLFFFLAAQHPCALFSDTIVLKDGSKEESERVWESDGYVHFILKGTKTVEIRYAKDIVERIERTEDQTVSTGNKKDFQPLENHAVAGAQEKNKLPEPLKEFIGTTLDAGRSKIDLRFIKANEGISFYDPHRPKRYWADAKSEFENLNSALTALAERYKRSREWVEHYMGEDNDLGKIHSNLMNQLDIETQPNSNITEKINKEKIPQQSMSSKDIFSNDSHESESLARLKKYILSDIPPNNTIGIQFYDPRRKEKYWTGPSKRFDTLREAIASLAEQYHVSQEWVEETMGDTNLIEEIHRNIQNKLEK